MICMHACVQVVSRPCQLFDTVTADGESEFAAAESCVAPCEADVELDEPDRFQGDSAVNTAEVSYLTFTRMRAQHIFDLRGDQVLQQRCLLQQRVLSGLTETYMLVYACVFKP